MRLIDPSRSPAAIILSCSSRAFVGRIGSAYFALLGWRRIVKRLIDRTAIVAAGAHDLLAPEFLLDRVAALAEILRASIGKAY